MRRPILLLALLVAAVLGAMAAKCWLIELPPVRASNTNAQFSAERAAERLAFVLGDQRPHPADTPANDMVRGKIVMLLQSMGLNPVVRDQVAQSLVGRRVDHDRQQPVLEAVAAEDVRIGRRDDRAHAPGGERPRRVLA